jgi:hypothetical protein
MRKPIIKKKKEGKWKKWLPLVLVLLMVVPSFIYFGAISKKTNVKVQFYTGSYSPVESLSVDENTTLMQIMTNYNTVIHDDMVYCMKGLCIDEGNWSFYVNGLPVNPFNYTLKDGDSILFEFK